MAWPGSFGNWPRKPAIRPVRISPVPPVPMAGVPVGLIQTRPSVKAISVRSPFSTTVTRRSVASPRAAARRSAEISAMVLPQSRAISPGCGVSTRSLPAPDHAEPASAFRASASTTMGCANSANARRTKATVSGSVPCPGPMAMTSLFSTMAERRPLESASVISSAAWPAMTGMADSSEATVTKPPPERSAAIPHMAEAAFVAGARARRQQVAEQDRLHQRQPNGIVRIVELRRAADGRHAQLTHGIAIRRQRVSRLGDGKGDGVIGARLLTQRLPGIAGHARGDIHGHDFGERKAAVDLANGVQHGASGRTADSGAQQCVHHDRRQAGFGGDFARHRTAAHLQHAVVLRGVAFQVFRRGQQNHMHGARLEAGEELAGHHHAIAAIVAFAAQHGDALHGQGRELFGQQLHYAMPGVFHEHQARDAHFDGAPIYFAHLRGGQNFHGRLATSMVISSDNSAASPDHCMTASIVRAMISGESRSTFLASKSVSRCSPNISPYSFSGSIMPSVYATSTSPLAIWMFLSS